MNHPGVVNLFFGGPPAVWQASGQPPNSQRRPRSKRPNRGQGGNAVKTEKTSMKGECGDNFPPTTRGEIKDQQSSLSSRDGRNRREGGFWKEEIKDQRPDSARGEVSTRRDAGVRGQPARVNGWRSRSPPWRQSEGGSGDKGRWRDDRRRREEGRFDSREVRDQGSNQYWRDAGRGRTSHLQRDGRGRGEEQRGGYDVRSTPAPQLARHFGTPEKARRYEKSEGGMMKEDVEEERLRKEVEESRLRGRPEIVVPEVKKTDEGGEVKRAETKQTDESNGGEDPVKQVTLFRYGFFLKTKSEETEEVKGARTKPADDKGEIDLVSAEEPKGADTKQNDEKKVKDRKKKKKKR